MAKQNVWIIAALAIAIIWVMNSQGGTDSGTSGGTSGGGTTDIPAGFLDTVITFESKDMYSPGTDAGTYHLIVSFGDGGQLENVAVADGGTKTVSNGDKYVVLIGNQTEGSFTGGTDYYAVLTKGTVPDKETYTISKDQPLSAGLSDLTFTYYNDDDTANTAQAIGASTEKTISVKLSVANDKCFGNPDTGEDNIMCFTYGTDSVQDVELVDHSRAGAPNNVVACAGNSTKCFHFPAICDNADTGKMKLRITSASEDPTTGNDNISISVHDTSYYVNADTLAVETGVQDEDLNDISVTDLGTTAGADMCADGFRSIALS